MYYTVEQVLEDVYKIRGVRMEPMNNTASVMHWCESKGVIGGGGENTGRLASLIEYIQAWSAGNGVEFGGMAEG